MRKLSFLIFSVVTVFTFSSCLFVGTEDERGVYFEKTDSAVKGSNSGSAYNNQTNDKFSFTCENKSSRKITDWMLKCENKAYFSNVSLDRSILPGSSATISGLDKGYYSIYIFFEDDSYMTFTFQLDSDKTYGIVAGNTSTNHFECK